MFYSYLYSSDYLPTPTIAAAATPTITAAATPTIAAAATPTIAAAATPTCITTRGYKSNMGTHLNSSMNIFDISPKIVWYCSNMSQLNQQNIKLNKHTYQKQLCTAWYIVWIVVLDYSCIVQE